MSQRSTEYDRLLDRLQDVLDGQLLDDVIPALTALLSSAIFESGMEKKVTIAYVVNAIDKRFAKGKQ
jgi:hypothetical protein